MKVLLFLTLLLFLSTAAPLATAVEQYSPEGAFSYLKGVYSSLFETRRGLDSPWQKFFYGFQRGGVKFQLRQAQTCFSEGYSFLTGFAGVATHYYWSRNQDDYFNLNDARRLGV